MKKFFAVFFGICLLISFVNSVSSCAKHGFVVPAPSVGGQTVAPQREEAGSAVEEGTAQQDETASSYSSAPSSNDRYGEAIGYAETLHEQYPDISWSSTWEEMMDAGYTEEEIEWAIGG